MLWLKRIDPLSRLIPAYFIKGRRPASAEKAVAVLRPGGLGDLVLLSRAAIELRIDLQKLHWICERRNAPWARYMGLPHSCYDSFHSLRELVSGRGCFQCVINSEQTFGLSALYSARLCAAGGSHVGFSSNRRADLYSTSVPYSERSHELALFKTLFAESAAAALCSDSVPPLVAAPPKHRGLAVVALAGLQVPGKRLSVALWQRLIHSAEERFAQVRLLGSPADVAFAKHLSGSGRTENLVGQLSFERVIEEIRSAERLISVDSGLVHVADFFGVPSSVYFPSGNPEKWSPLSTNSCIYQEREVEEFLSLS